MDNPNLNMSDIDHTNKSSTGPSSLDNPFLRQHNDIVEIREQVYID